MGYIQRKESTEQVSQFLQIPISISYISFTAHKAIGNSSICLWHKIWDGLFQDESAWIGLSVWEFLPTQGKPPLFLLDDGNSDDPVCLLSTNKSHMVIFQLTQSIQVQRAPSQSFSFEEHICWRNGQENLCRMSINWPCLSFINTNGNSGPQEF